MSKRSDYSGLSENIRKLKFNLWECPVDAFIKFEVIFKTYSY